MKRRIFSILAVLVLVLSFSLVTAVPAAAQTIWYVATTGNDSTGNGTSGTPWATITKAITESIAGDTISVAAGTYDAEASWPIDVSKALTIQGAGTSSIIDPAGNGQGVIAITVDSVTIDGFKITHGTETADAAHPTEHTVWVDAEYSTIKNNTILTRGGNKAGIYIGGRVDPDPESLFLYNQPKPLGHTIQNNIFRNANAGEGWGIFAYEIKDSLIKGNTFSGESGQDYTADAQAWAGYSEGAPGTGIIIHKASAAVGSPSPGEGYVVIEDNTTQYLRYTWLTFSPHFMFVDNDGAGYEKVEASTVEKVIVQNNTVSDSDVGVTLKPSFIDGSPYADDAASLTIGSDLVTIGPGNNFHDVYKCVDIDDPNNELSSAYYGVLNAANIVINYNLFVDASEAGVYNGMHHDGLAAAMLGSSGDVLGDFEIDAEKNWWGHPTGADPATEADNPHGAAAAGVVVTDDIDFTPWYATATTTSSRQYVEVDHTFSSTIAYSDTIQGGIDAALAGDTISVAAGEYNEQVYINEANLTVQSTAGKATTFIDGTGVTDADLIPGHGALVWLQKDGITLEGFTVRDYPVGWGNGGVVYLQGWNGTTVDDITGCAITDNTITVSTDPDCGIVVSGGADSNTISDNTITVSADGGDAIIISGTAGNDTTGNQITGNTIASMKYGVSLSTDSWGTPRSFPGTDISDNIISGGTQGIGILYAAGTSGSHITIEDNTISGVVTGEAEGIEIYAGDYVDMSGNTLQGNGTGLQVKTCTATVNIVANYNDITGNTTYGVEAANNDATLDAQYNYWGSATGPAIAATNPDGAGDSVSADVDYAPWLYLTAETDSDTVAEIITNEVPAYANSVLLDTVGWNTFSVPIALDGQYNTWAELYTLTGLDYTLAYRFDTTTQTFESLGTADTYAIAPGEAFYVKMASAGSIPYCYNTEFSMPTRDLEDDWNLISGGMDGTMDEKDACISIATAGGTAGYSHIISTAENAAAPWVYIAGAGSSSGDFVVGEGYWAFLVIDRTLGLFDQTPVAWVPLP